jgi:D-alanyl-D-alanine carboxypeptidase/D-alanyl-D-alanine-endopeptidase (penicillin-binding protein 4)
MKARPETALRRRRDPRKRGTGPAALLLLGLVASPFLWACSSILCNLPHRESPHGLHAKDLSSLLLGDKAPTADWGAVVLDAKTGRVMFGLGEKRLFTCGSVLKLITTAAALDRLGPDYRFRTKLLFPIDGLRPGGVVEGDIVLVGGGDPTLGDLDDYLESRRVFDEWAELLLSRGVREVRGNILGDDRVFSKEPLGRGWSWDDEALPFSAQTSGLTFAESSVGYEVTLISPADYHPEFQLRLTPPTGYVKVTVDGSPDLKTSKVVRKRCTNEVHLTVPIGKPVNTVFSGRFTVENPTAFAATVLKESLEANGIAILGAALDANDVPSYQRQNVTEYLTHDSAPLSRIIAYTNKNSVNLCAEHLLRILGYEVAHDGSIRTGLKEIRRFLENLGIDPQSMQVVDGSGLSRYNLLAPLDVARLLYCMRQHSHSDVYRRSLAIAGVDGMLADRFQGTPLVGKVVGKTGSMRGVRAFAGYLETRTGHDVIVVLVANQFVAEDSEIVSVGDRFLLEVWRTL